MTITSTMLIITLHNFRFKQKPPKTPTKQKKIAQRFALVRGWFVAAVWHLAGGSLLEGLAQLSQSVCTNMLIVWNKFLAMVKIKL